MAQGLATQSIVCRGSLDLVTPQRPRWCWAMKMTSTPRRAISVSKPLYTRPKHYRCRYQMLPCKSLTRILRLVLPPCILRCLSLGVSYFILHKSLRHYNHVNILFVVSETITRSAIQSIGDGSLDKLLFGGSTASAGGLGESMYAVSMGSSNQQLKNSTVTMDMSEDNLYNVSVGSSLMADMAAVGGRKGNHASSSSASVPKQKNHSVSDNLSTPHLVSRSSASTNSKVLYSIHPMYDYLFRRCYLIFYGCVRACGVEENRQEEDGSWRCQHHFNVKLATAYAFHVGGMYVCLYI